MDSNGEILPRSSIDLIQLNQWHQWPAASLSSHCCRQVIALHAEAVGKKTSHRWACNDRHVSGGAHRKTWCVNHLTMLVNLNKAERCWKDLVHPCPSNLLNFHGNPRKPLQSLGTDFFCRWAIVCGLKTCWKQWRIHEGWIGNSNQEAPWGCRNCQENLIPQDLWRVTYEQHGHLHFCKVFLGLFQHAEVLDPWNRIRILMDTLKPTVPTNKKMCVIVSMYMIFYTL